MNGGKTKWIIKDSTIPIAGIENGIKCRKEENYSIRNVIVNNLITSLNARYFEVKIVNNTKDRGERESFGIGLAPQDIPTYKAIGIWPG